MKKQVLIAGMIMVTAITLGQKKEIKKADKAIKAGNFTEATNYLNTAESLLAAADDKLRGMYYLSRGEALTGSANGDFEKMKKASEAYKEASALGANKERLSTGKTTLRNALIDSAIKDQNAKNYKGATEKLYSCYVLSKKDTSSLYFAAGNAVNGKDYPTALSYYKTLLDMGYTGKTTQFVATNKSTGEVAGFSSKKERDFAILSKEYIKPDVVKEESKRGEILRNMTLIYIENGENDKATKLMAEARAANPNDMSLVRSEANMAYKMGDLNKYNSLMEEVIKSDPNNPELYFNLGVTTSNLGDVDKAINYYTKAIELNPNYANALINLAILKLGKEKAIVEEMNGLGTSKADNKRYEVLKESRNKMYREAIPYLERAIEARPDGDNIELMKTLMNIYSTTGDDAKFREMKAKVKGME